MQSLNAFTLPQFFGFVALAFGVLAFYQKDDRKLKLMMLGLNISYVIHFGLLGAMFACMCSSINAVRTLTSIKTKSKYAASFFILIAVVIGVTYAEQPIDYLPTIGTVLSTSALFFFTGIKMRIVLLMAASCWLVNNYVVGSIGGFILESIIISVNIFTMVRMTMGDKAKA